MGFWPRGPLCLATPAPPGQRGAGRRPGRKSTSYKLSPGRRGPGRADGIHAGSLLAVSGEVASFPSPALLADLTLPSPAQGFRFRLLPPVPPLSRLNSPRGGWGRPEATLPRAPAPLQVLLERCASETSLKEPRSRAHFTWTRWDETGRSSAGEGTCRERPVLNPSVGLRRAHAGVRTGGDPTAPLSIAAPPLRRSDSAAGAPPGAPKKPPRGQRCPSRRWCARF